MHDGMGHDAPPQIEAGDSDLLQRRRTRSAEIDTGADNLDP
jgi:hypothetical protein